VDKTRSVWRCTECREEAWGSWGETVYKESGVDETAVGKSAGSSLYDFDEIFMSRSEAIDKMKAMAARGRVR
jgi:hypothetical protein